MAFSALQTIRSDEDICMTSPPCGGATLHPSFAATWEARHAAIAGRSRVFVTCPSTVLVAASVGLWRLIRDPQPIGGGPSRRRLSSENLATAAQVHVAMTRLEVVPTTDIGDPLLRDLNSGPVGSLGMGCSSTHLSREIHAHCAIPETPCPVDAMPRGGLANALREVGSSSAHCCSRRADARPPRGGARA